MPKLKRFYVVKEQAQSSIMGCQVIRNAQIIECESEEQLLQSEVFDTKDTIITFYKELK